VPAAQLQDHKDSLAGFGVWTSQSGANQETRQRGAHADEAEPLREELAACGKG
jgi:hypothetical protein